LLEAANRKLQLNPGPDENRDHDRDAASRDTPTQQVATRDGDGGAGERERERLLAELKRSNAKLRSFAHTAAHDLKGPLTSVLGFTEVIIRLHGEKLGAHGRVKLEHIRRATVRMNDLVNSLLLYATADAAPAQKRKVSLERATREVLADLSVPIEEAEAKVELGDLPMIYADPVMLRQLLQNLIGNSIKYRNPDVAPVVRILAAVDEEQGECTFSVADNGMGFEQEKAEQIFEPFTRLVAKSQVAGSGIGMATAKKIVDAHLGTIRASGSPGAGAVFTVTLPNHGAAPAPVASRKHQHAPSDRKLRMLLVDDDEELLELYKVTLEESFEIRVAASPKQALQCLMGATFDVVLSDFDMPQQNGAVFLAHMKKNHPQTRRFLMSTLAETQLEKHLAGDVVESFFEKPVDVADLLSELEPKSK